MGSFQLLTLCVCWHHRSTEIGVLQVAASQYLAALIIGFVNSATVQPVIAIERTVFHREKAAGMCTRPESSLWLLLLTVFFYEPAIAPISN